MTVFLCAAAPGHSMGGDEGEVVEAEVGTAGMTSERYKADSHSRAPGLSRHGSEL